MSVPLHLRASLVRLTANARGAAIQTRCQHVWSRQRTGFQASQLQHRLLLRGQKTFQQRRYAGSFTGNTKKLFKHYPISMSLAVASIIFGAGMLVMVNYIYFKYIIGALHNYPEPVAAKLRKAMYYTNTDFRPREAMKYYKQAILTAEEVGMDAYSDEVIGIKLAVAHLMEQLEQYPKEAQALEVIRKQCLDWIKEHGQEEENKKKRTKLLEWSTKMAIKLGELYSRPEIWDRAAAEERLSWAVETMLRERLRRDTLKILDEEEGTWMSNDEIGAAIENLADEYESKDQHYLAAPLYLHAINLHQPQSCHSVVLMNNLASSLAQQSPRAAAAAQAIQQSQTISERPPYAPVSREMLIEMAQTWAQNALNVAATIKPPERDEDCDVGCAVAVHNLGELAEMVKDFDEAKKRYREAASLARAIGFQEGLENSTARLNKLEQAG